MRKLIFLLFLGITSSVFGQKNNAIVIANSKAPDKLTVKPELSFHAPIRCCDGPYELKIDNMPMLVPDSSFVSNMLVAVAGQLPKTDTYPNTTLKASELLYKKPWELEALLIPKKRYHRNNWDY